MKLFAGKKTPHVTEEVGSKTVPDSTIIQPIKPLKKGKLTGTLKKVGTFLLRSIAVLVPVAIIFGGVPALVIGGASIIQPFFKATNFNITGSVTAFSSLQKKATLAMDANGLTNVLIVGIDTRASGSALLNTDTIILASYNNKTNEMAMVSFPRDLDITYPNSPSYGKINATYAYGEYRQSGGGMEYLRQAIEGITGKKIQYHVLVDLKGFTTIIDLLGGVDVDVNPGFSGYYPTEGYGWESVTFPRGMNHMDGRRALQYARIRHVYNADTYADYVAEASDFGRARRQQKIIQAVMDKATKAENLTNTKAIFEILGTVANNIKINQITPSDVEAGIMLLKDKGKPYTYSMVLDPSAGGGRLIMRDPDTYLYELRPTAGRNNWSAIQPYLSAYFDEPLLATSTQHIIVFNSGSTNYDSRYADLTWSIPRATYMNKGLTPDVPAIGVYNLGGKMFAGTAMHVADIMHIPYHEVADPKTFTPQQNISNIVVIL